MDDFVCEKLTEWGLSNLIQTFKDQYITEESLYLLTEKDIDELIPVTGLKAIFRAKLQLLKEGENATNKRNEESAEAAKVSPQRKKGKRMTEPEEESQSPKMRRLESAAAEVTLSKVKEIMKRVEDGLPKTEINDFLSKKILDLETERKEVVGVFGRTGAGKSSLINALIGEENLLPSGDLGACTTVIIQVEANMKNKKYEAEIEFISEGDLEEDLWGLRRIVLSDADDEEENDDDGGDSGGDVTDKVIYSDAVEVLSTLYGAKWKEICADDDLMNKKHFREVPEFFEPGKKVLTSLSPEKLSEDLVKFTRGSSGGEDTRRWFWPLVKFVTIRVPNNDFLQHVTLVDLPGAGDRNKRRDNMWKEVLGNCSTVWVLAEISRALAEKEPWEILENASSDMGNGGQCQRIHFICTKSDAIKRLRGQSAADVRSAILSRNQRAKDELMKELRQKKTLRKHFSAECFKVFTVSSTEFQERQWLDPGDTEVPKLKAHLQHLSDCQSKTETLNYVSGAKGILSLIQGASNGEVSEDKEELYTVLKENLAHGLGAVSGSIRKAITAFDILLRRGVDHSKSTCDHTLESFLKLKRKGKGRGFHRTLKCVVKNNGVYKPRKGKQLNLNEELASKLKESIDEEFRKTFPNESKKEPFNGAIGAFSLNTETLAEQYLDGTGMQLRLEYLSTEQMMMLTGLFKDIRECKKTIYSSLTTKIEKLMEPCYEKAQQCEGKGCLDKMRNIIMRHVETNKDNMFEEVKNKMLEDLENLKAYILRKLEKDMLLGIEYALREYSESFPDVEEDLEKVTVYYEKLKYAAERTSAASADQPGTSTA